MSSANTRYTARFQLPDLFERGRDELFTCPVYRDDVLVLPSLGNAYVYDKGGTELFSASATFPSSIATATLPAAAAASHDFEEGWRVAWLLTMPDGVQHRFENDGALVRKRLYPTITGADIVRRLRALDTTLPAVITTRSNYQDVIDEADVELQNDLIAMGRRPWLIATPTALRKTWLTLSIALVFESLAAQNEAQYGATAASWRTKYGAALGEASLRYDTDQDGQVTNTEERKGAKPAAVWLC